MSKGSHAAAATLPHLRYAHGGFVVLRTPLLPFDTFLALSALAESANIQKALPHPENVLAANRALLGAFVRSCFAQPALREALFVASPDLHEALCKAEKSGDGRLEDRALLALARYLARATFRPTPFGLFAGCSTVPIREHTRLELEGLNSYSRHTRLDMDYLTELTRELAGTAEVRRSVRLSPNTSIHAFDGSLHYVAAQYVDGSRRYSLEAVDASEAISDTLARAGAGTTFDAMARALVDDEVTIDDAYTFIDELIDAQILVPEIDPAITGGDGTRALLSVVERVPERVTYAESLRDASHQLRAIDAQGVGVAPSSYVACVERLRILPVPVNTARLFQVDLYKPARQACFGEAVAVEASRAADILCRIASGADPLAEFRELFRERYEEREVPLLEALDDEIGIGLESRERPSPFAHEHAEAARLREAWLAELSARAVRRGEEAVELSAEDLKRLEPVKPLDFPDSVAIVGTLLAQSSGHIDAGSFRLLVTYCAGPSGASFLGRFCHLDAGLCELVRDHLRAEERLRPDAVFAEVVHLPRGRVGNVLSRPTLRAFEIPYLGRSSVQPEGQIAVSDLTLSIADGRMVVRSRRLGREVVPRLTSAHNYADRRGLPVYRFLGMLQRHGMPQRTMWDWGQHGAVAAFLPRVTVGRLILSRARWLLSAEELRPLASAGGGERFRALHDWRTRRNIPRFVVLADGDNQLPLDLENVLNIDVFIDLARKRQSAILLEMLPLADELPVHGPEGRFTHEFIIPLTKTTAEASRAEPKRAPPSARQEIRGRRSFAPGSRWLYAKLYCGPGMSDHLLQTLVAPFAREMVSSGFASQWFFIRYRDPFFHLRVRLCGTAETLQTAMVRRLAAVVEPLLEGGTLARVQHDTYFREIERYGGDAGMALAERLFYANSECALDLIANAPARTVAEDVANDRLCSAIAAVHALFEAFGLPLERRRQVLESTSGASAASRRAWGEWYRRQRADLQVALSREPSGGPAQWRTAALALSLERVRPIAEELVQLERDGALSRTVDDLLGSFAHMSVNRILRPEQTLGERMCYDALSRYYQSLLARGLVTA